MLYLCNLYIILGLLPHFVIYQFFKKRLVTILYINYGFEQISKTYIIIYTHCIRYFLQPGKTQARSSRNFKLKNAREKSDANLSKQQSSIGIFL